MIRVFLRFSFLGGVGLCCIPGLPNYPCLKVTFLEGSLWLLLLVMVKVVYGFLMVFPRM